MSPRVGGSKPRARSAQPVRPFKSPIKSLFRWSLVATALVFFTACSEPADSTTEVEGRRIRVVTTTTTVQDMVAAIGGERVAIDNLMGPGVDPHLYRPSVMDLRRVRRTEGIFYVGLRFEDLMQDVLEERQQAGQKVFALTDAIPRDELLETEPGSEIYDPHVWFDIEVWSQCIDVVLEGLIELDPENREDYEARAEIHRKELMELHEWSLEKAAELPEEDRILITSHDAYSYFGRAYGFQVIGLMGISTASEAGLADLTRLIDFIRDNQVKAIFVESSVSHRAIERVSRDSGVQIGGELFSDALGPLGEERLGYDVGTLNGVARYNLTTIVDALR